MCVLASAATSCGWGDEVVYLIRDGYVGPVVVIYGDPGGEKLVEEDGAKILRVPSSGILRLSAPPPKGSYQIRHFYTLSDGDRREIPHQGADDVVQICVYADGSTGSRDDSRVLWSAFLVGVPGDRGQMVSRRQAAVGRAVASSKGK